MQLLPHPAPKPFTGVTLSTPHLSISNTNSSPALSILKDNPEVVLLTTVLRTMTPTLLFRLAPSLSLIMMMENMASGTFLLPLPSQLYAML